MDRSWTPFQIDANMGWTAAVLEMLAFTREDRLDLFPSVPARWTKGGFRGLGTRCGVTADLEWDEAQWRAELTALREADILIGLPRESAGADLFARGRRPSPERRENKGDVTDNGYEAVV